MPYALCPQRIAPPPGIQIPQSLNFSVRRGVNQRSPRKTERHLDPGKSCLHLNDFFVKKI
jgi:hypothetical protein